MKNKANLNLRESTTRHLPSIDSAEQPCDPTNAGLHGLDGLPGVAEPEEPGLADVARGAGGEVDPGLLEDLEPQCVLCLPRRSRQVRPEIEQDEDAGLGRYVANPMGGWVPLFALTHCCDQ